MTSNEFKSERPNCLVESLDNGQQINETNELMEKEEKTGLV